MYRPLFALAAAGLIAVSGCGVLQTGQQNEPYPDDPGTYRDTGYGQVSQTAIRACKTEIVGRWRMPESHTRIRGRPAPDLPDPVDLDLAPWPTEEPTEGPPDADRLPSAQLEQTLRRHGLDTVLTHPHEAYYVVQFTLAKGGENDALYGRHEK